MAKQEWTDDEPRGSWWGRVIWGLVLLGVLYAAGYLAYRVTLKPVFQELHKTRETFRKEIQRR